MSLFLISILASFGLSVLLVEKGEDWPMSLFVGPIRSIFGKINPKVADIFDCTVCMSFWTSLIVEVCMYFFMGKIYFLWPLSGFAVVGLTWLVIQVLDAIESRNNQ